MPLDQRLASAAPPASAPSRCADRVRPPRCPPKPETRTETTVLPPASGAPDILGLSRNLGEVLGVFAVFHPQKDGPLINFIKTNSAHFEGLAALEDLIKKIGPPKWPWAVNPMLARRASWT